MSLAGGVCEPTDAEADALQNWPSWRKALHFYSLLMGVAMTGVTKTMFMTVNAQIAEMYNVSYTAVVALTAIPLVLSAAAGLACLVASRICGKRPLYLASLLCLFVGTVWGARITGSYAQCMAARVFQGLGWAAFDTLVMGSIHDTFFDHERGIRVAIHSIVCTATTWGPPLLGGIASQGPSGFRLQPTILSAFFVVSVPAIALGVPETAYDRTSPSPQTPSTADSEFSNAPTPVTQRHVPRLKAVAGYLTVQRKPKASSNKADLRTLLQAPRALITPTTALLALASLLPYGSLWGLASSLSLLLHPAPSALPPASTGAVFLGPFLLSSAATAATALLPAWQHRFSPRMHVAALAAASALALAGLVAFALPLAGEAVAEKGQPTSTAPASTLAACSALGAGIFVAGTPGAVAGWWWGGQRRQRDGVGAFCAGVARRRRRWPAPWPSCGGSAGKRSGGGTGGWWG
ncbi:hypothetical protein VTH06DRAFT_91 [Thermothelomyces fergusii]